MRIRMLLVLLCLPTWAAQLWLGPYLQDVSGSRATVQWATVGDAGVGEVRILPSGPVVRSLVEEILPERSRLPVTVFLHRATIQGLESGKQYQYEVRINGLNVNPGKQLSFRSEGPGPFRFIVFGDSGDGGEPQRELAVRMRDEDANFMLHVGDMAYWQGNFIQFAETFFWVYPEMLSRMALFPTPGNHDYEFQDALAYRTFFSVPAGRVDAAGRGRYYSFDWGPVHFSVIDSNTSLMEALQGRGSMLRWLDEDLRLTRKPWRVAVVHHPPFPTSPEKLEDPTSKLVASHITPILERHGVQLLLAGHEHIYQRTKARRSQQFVGDSSGTVYITTGGGGSQLYDPGPGAFVAASASGSHYLRISVDRQQMRVEMVNANGAVKDATVLSSAPAIFETGLVNGASYTADYGLGGLVSIFGWNLATGSDSATGIVLPAELAGTRVNLGTRPMGLLYAGPTQLNLLLPEELENGSRMQVQTSEGSVTSPVAAKLVAPALFSQRVDGRDVVLAVHTDGSLVDASRPAIPGEWLMVFGTGLGRMRNSPVYGRVASLAPLATAQGSVSVTVGGIQTEVYFAGLAPGYWGLNQINFKVPAVVGRVPLQVTVDGVGSTSLELPVRQ